MLGAVQLPPIESPITTLINDIVIVAEPFALVLNDYYTIHMEWIDQAIEYLIVHQPPQLHIFLVTRQDSPLPLPRLRVRVEVAEFRADDLRFTTEEAADFLNKSMGLTLDAEVITAPEKRTAGWVAGMQTAALSMHRRSLDGMAEFIEAFSSR